eukprot:Selendium_serpulae@DN6093_c2_g1_i13.p1
MHTPTRAFTCTDPEVEPKLDDPVPKYPAFTIHLRPRRTGRVYFALQVKLQDGSRALRYPAMGLNTVFVDRVIQYAIVNSSLEGFTYRTDEQDDLQSSLAIYNRLFNLGNSDNTSFELLDNCVPEYLESGDILIPIFCTGVF